MAHNTSNLTAYRKREDALNRAACPPPIWAPPADTKRFSNGTTIKHGVAIPDSRPQPTVAQQSACRGFVHPGPKHQRDYSHCRGDFPRVEMTRRALDIPQTGHVLVSALLDYYLSDKGDLQEYAVTKAAQAYKNTIRSGGEWEEPSPPDRGGTNAADREHAVHQRLAECARVLGDSPGVERVSSPSANQSPLHQEWLDLQAAAESGDTVMIPTPPIPRNGGLKLIEQPLTEHPAINPQAVKHHVMDIFGYPAPTYGRRECAQYFVIKEGLTGSCIIFYHKDRPGTFVVIGYWSPMSNGRHRWNLNKKFHKRLDELYARLGLPIIERVNEALPV